MVKPEWGTKRYCQKCHSKYYDMKKDPIKCPSCDTEYKPEFLRSRDDLRASAAKEEIIIDADDVIETDLDADDDDDDEVVVDADITKEDDEDA